MTRRRDRTSYLDKEIYFKKAQKLINSVVCESEMAGRRKPPPQHYHNKEEREFTTDNKFDGDPRKAEEFLKQIARRAGNIKGLEAECLYGNSAKNIFRNRTETASARISSTISGMERIASRCCIKTIDWYIWYSSTIPMLGFVYISNPWMAIFG